MADSILLSDRQRKAKIYASAGSLDYWSLDVNQRQVYVFRALTQTGYQQETVLPANSLLAPVAFPTLAIPLNQLFLQSA